MSTASLPRWGPSLERLAVRARRGDRRAVAALRNRMAPELRQLALALCADPAAVPGVVRGALADALADSARPYTVALVAAVQRRAGAARVRATSTRSAPERLRQAVGVLCDVQGHSHASAAALLGQPVSAVAALHAESRSTLGIDERRNDCRGWHLVSRMDALTPPEQAAGQAHLDACRRCRDALEARAAARSRLKAAVPVGGTAVGGAVVAMLSTLGGGSMAAGAVAVGAAAVLGTAAVAVPALTPPAPADAPVTVRQDSAPRTTQDSIDQGAADAGPGGTGDGSGGGGLSPGGDPARQLSSVGGGATVIDPTAGDPAAPTGPDGDQAEEPAPGPTGTPAPEPTVPLPIPLPEPTLPVPPPPPPSPSPSPSDLPLPLPPPPPLPSPTLSPLPMLEPVPIPVL